ncbi:MAG: T9SS type A sorting domain-containing protein [Bacteroidota bacterium]
MKKRLLNLFFLLLITNATALYAQDGRITISPIGVVASYDSRLSSAHFEMSQNTPNPFYSTTDISFYMPVQGFIEFKLVNLIGKEMVRQVLEADPGRNSVRFDGSDFMPGVYIYSISNGSQTLTRRMIISKK